MLLSVQQVETKYVFVLGETGVFKKALCLENTEGHLEKSC